MQNALTLEQLVQLPITLTERAWSEVMSVARYPDEMKRYIRLGYLIRDAYSALRQSSDADSAEFSVMCAEPTDEIEFPEEIHLVARLGAGDHTASFVLIMLKDEEPGTPTAMPF
ncbi:hypothetical protein ACCD10_25390 [Pseudomonas sp. Pseusp122]|uniref:hypothetical protein n=1 Tax=unclassified Pseudomonas TaxID=196821 RepID=UPI0039A50141